MCAEMLMLLGLMSMSSVYAVAKEGCYDDRLDTMTFQHAD